MPILFRAAAAAAAIALLSISPLPSASAAGLETEAGSATAPEMGQRRYWLTVARTNEGVVLAGMVPDELTRTVLTTYAAALFGAARVQDTLSVVDGTVPTEWSTMAMAAMETLSNVDGGQAEVTEGRVLMSGAVPVPEEAGVLTRALRERLPPGVRVSTRFDVQLPVLEEQQTLPSERCAWLMTEIARERQILFASGSAEIEEESLPGLSAIAALFDRCPDAEIEVRGYTDDAGAEEMNLDLSQARAETVLAVLQDAGVALRQLRARGFGEVNPVADNQTEEGRARNRRIEFEAVE